MALVLPRGRFLDRTWNEAFSIHTNFKYHQLLFHTSLSICSKWNRNQMNQTSTTKRLLAPRKVFQYIYSICLQTICFQLTYSFCFNVTGDCSFGRHALALVKLHYWKRQHVIQYRIQPDTTLYWKPIRARNNCNVLAGDIVDMFWWRSIRQAISYVTAVVVIVSAQGNSFIPEALTHQEMPGGIQNIKDSASNICNTEHTSLQDTNTIVNECIYIAKQVCENLWK